MYSLSEKWYRDVANIYEAYNLFYDRSPDFCAKYRDDQERIKIEFQTMAYLIEYGLEIVLGEEKYPTYSFCDTLCNPDPKSKKLMETVDFLMSIKNPNEYIKKDMCTLDEQKKILIKRYGRLFCIKVGNPSSIQKLSSMLRTYYIAHEDVGISRYSIMRKKEDYLSKGSLQTLLETYGLEQKSVFSTIENPDKHFLNEDDYCIKTNGFIGSEDWEIVPSYEYLTNVRTYRMNAIGLGDPFIHYVKNFLTFDIKWDREWKQLAKEEKENKNNKNNEIKDMQEVASNPTVEKSMELICNCEQIIQEKMRKIEEEEYQSEVAIMEDDEDYDDNNWNMILESGGQSNSLKTSNVQKKVLVRERTDNNESSK